MTPQTWNDVRRSTEAEFHEFRAVLRRVADAYTITPDRLNAFLYAHTDALRAWTRVFRGGGE